MQTIRPRHSFLLLIQWDEKNLFLTYHSGKQYKFDCTPQEWEKINLANNKGNFIATQIMPRKGTFVKMLTIAEVNQISNYQNYLAK